MINKLYITILTLHSFFSFCFQGGCQELTIETCYEKARSNYPLVKNFDLIEESRSYTVENIARMRWPTISFSGQISYQSDVTEIPIDLPNVNIPALNRDQYRLYADINQPITKLFITPIQEQLQNNITNIKKGQLESDIYTIKSRINELYFGILLVDETIKQSLLTKKDILTGIETTKAAVKNGAAYQSSLDRLNASLLEIDQNLLELNEQRSSFINMLSHFIGEEIPLSISLIKPDQLLEKKQIVRPEIQVFEMQKENNKLRSELLQTKTLPQFSLFLQTGIGRPSPVNLLDNNWSTYLWGGVRFRWDIGNFYTQKNNFQLLAVDKENIRVQEETFLFNTKLAIEKNRSEIKKLKSLLHTDSKVIELRNSIKLTIETQLQNGIITANEYLKEVYAEEKARQLKSLHEIKLIMNQYLLQTTIGK
ncbi:TolC family protein [Membranihabitans maritimus]|uniref:TolC family protein n=1 Tax=Membranihabitans maritimus TaxID=2904244 RepID=UPI001F020540|nr:TolC family protein [Membranihabitans maritimus]